MNCVRRRLGINPAEPLPAGIVAATLGLIPFCVPLQLIEYTRAGTCSELWVYGGSLYLALLVGLITGRHGRPPVVSVSARSIWPWLFRLSRLMLGASLVGNLGLVTGAVALYGPADVLTYKRVFDVVPAVSLFAQFHVPFLVPYIFIARSNARPWKTLVTLLLVVLTLRAVVLGERLTLVEGVVLTVIALGLLGDLRLRARHFALAAVTFAVLWFGTEMTRLYHRQFGRFVGVNAQTVEFSARWLTERLVGYYADPANKLLVAKRYMAPNLWPEAFAPVPLRVFEIIGLDIAHETSASKMRAIGVAGGYTFVEFTNPGGLTVLALDWDWPGTFALLGMWGVFVGWLYRRARAGYPVALMLYGGVLLSILELPRIFYLGIDRFLVPMIIGGAVLLVVLASVIRVGGSAEPVHERGGT